MSPAGLDTLFVDEVESHGGITVKSNLHELPLELLQRSPFSIFGGRQKFGLGGNRAIVADIHKIVG